MGPSFVLVFVLVFAQVRSRAVKILATLQSLCVENCQDSFQRQFSEIRSRADGIGHPVPWPLPVPLASPRLLFHCPWTYGIPPGFCFESLSCPDLPNGDLKYVLQSSKQSERHPPRLLRRYFFRSLECAGFIWTENRLALFGGISFPLQCPSQNQRGLARRLQVTAFGLIYVEESARSKNEAFGT